MPTSGRSVCTHKDETIRAMWIPQPTCLNKMGLKYSQTERSASGEEECKEHFKWRNVFWKVRDLKRIANC